MRARARTDTSSIKSEGNSTPEAALPEKLLRASVRKFPYNARMMRKYLSLAALVAATFVFTACKEELPGGIVDVEKVIPGIVLDIRYATTNNFTGKVVYPAARCFLRKPVAEKLAKVQVELKQQGLGLKVYDGFRPLSVQRIFWQIVPDERYVANPAKGSRHNRGAAVDLTIIDANGKDLLMPTDYDDFSEKAHRDYKQLPEEAIRNSALLEKVMTKHGFVGLPTEWWHFDDADWQSYDLLDMDLSDFSQR